MPSAAGANTATAAKLYGWRRRDCFALGRVGELRFKSSISVMRNERAGV